MSLDASWNMNTARYCLVDTYDLPRGRPCCIKLDRCEVKMDRVKCGILERR